ncbi:MAG: UDP-3-O-acyl-N-acetylglucosamine deacetylase, partial [Myxococcota bacterium]|nr:UDP-3-O-acyl-N-acetylglucosamine deacetylase [Myxococcota bacterium]
SSCAALFKERAKDAFLPAEVKSIWGLKPVSALSSIHKQRTIQNAFRVEGYGIHTGQKAVVQLLPAPMNSGRTFIRQRVRIPAHLENLHSSQRATILQKEGSSVQTVEHLLSALQGLFIDNVDIHIDGPELPILDGSSRVWAQAIETAGVDVQSAEPNIWSPNRPLSCQMGSASMQCDPDNQLQIEADIDFSNYNIRQRHHFSLTPQNYLQEIAPARTFGFAEEYAYLKRNQLALGASLSNVLVLSQSGLHPEQALRFPNELVRHKILDVIGDLALLNCRTHARIRAQRPGHSLTHNLLKRSLMS